MSLATPSNLRRAAILWFVAAALSLTAAVLNYVDGEEVRWPLLAATLFLAAVGWSTLRRARSAGG